MGGSSALFAEGRELFKRGDLGGVGIHCTPLQWHIGILKDCD